MIIPSRRRVVVAAAVIAAVWGAVVAVHYAHLGLTLSHYDARGHLVVARRIFDSITPGWRQIGAVWLPLPHLLNAIPVQVDAWYRSGFSATVMSILAFALGAGALASIVGSLTGSPVAMIAALAVYVLNPSLLYLQATPMTEPLFLGLTLAGIALLLRWLDPEATRPPRATTVGWVFALACLTRYEAWPATVCAIGVAAWTWWRRGARPLEALRRTRPVALPPAAAILGFMAFSKIVVGAWFVSSGFFVPENKALGRPFLSVTEILWGIEALSGWFVVGAASAGLAVAAVRGVISRRRAADAVVIALVAMEAVAWAAFFKGHPYRIRYMVPLVAAEAVGIGVLASLAPRGAWRNAIALVLLAATAYDLRPFDPKAPMVLEAQWDHANSVGRRAVTRCLADGYDGTTILASMGSLGHYMQETAAAGFDVRDFLHEGNGVLWPAAVADPRPYAGWILIEERAEGGDVLAKRSRENPEFLDGFSRVCSGGGVALYRRQNRMLNTSR